MPHHATNARWLIAASCAALLYCAAADVRGDCTEGWNTAIGNPGMNGTVVALAVLPNGDLIAGGGFTMAGGKPANLVARWDGTDWHPMGDGFDDGVILVLHILENDDLIAGGSFTTTGGVEVNRIARWDGSAWHPLGSGIEKGSVRAIAEMPNGDIIVGGSSMSPGGQPTGSIARWDGATWHAMGDVTHYRSISGFAVMHDGDEPVLYAAGFAEPLWAPGVSRWDGESWHVLSGGIQPSRVHDLAVFNDGDGPALFATGELFLNPPQSPGVIMAYSGKWNGHAWEPLSTANVAWDLTEFETRDGPALLAGYRQPAFGSRGIAQWGHRARRKRFGSCCA